MQKPIHRVVIVGGGAGGLELATRLGDHFGKQKKLHITLVDKNRTHIWKPKLHEIASGSMNIHSHEVDYMAQAHWHHFAYQIGEMVGLERSQKKVLIGAYCDDKGKEVSPARHLEYDTLVLSIGSMSNDFGTDGVSQHAMRIDSQVDAKNFHQQLLNACIRAQTQKGPIKPWQMHVAIIGAGATGVELAAELHRTTREVVAFGLDNVNPETDLKVSLVEAAPRILPALPERISGAAHAYLEKMGVTVYTDAKVQRVGEHAVDLADGRSLEAELVVWAAGVKAPDFLKDIDGLETSRTNQLLVLQTLQTSRDSDIFAMGDCAACAWAQANGGQGGWVPPRAQAAHQQADHLFLQMKRRLAHQALKNYTYKDFGSLVSLGKYSTVGNMMSGMGSSMMIEGAFAKMMYLSLYKLHELALHGWAKVTLDTLARLISSRTEPHVKLH